MALRVRVRVSVVDPPSNREGSTWSDLRDDESAADGDEGVLGYTDAKASPTTSGDAGLGVTP